MGSPLALPGELSMAPVSLAGRRGGVPSRDLGPRRRRRRVAVSPSPGSVAYAASPPRHLRRPPGGPAALAPAAAGRGAKAMSRKQAAKSRPGSGSRKAEAERKRDERAARRALAKERRNRPEPGGGGGCEEEFVSFANQLQALGLKLREVPGDG